MYPRKLFLHDGLKESPKVEGVPAGELLGDLPSRPFVPGQARVRPAATCYIGGVFTMDRYKEAIAPDARNSQPNEGGDPACSNFNNAVLFVEWTLLGVISPRVEG